MAPPVFPVLQPHPLAHLTKLVAVKIEDLVETSPPFSDLWHGENIGRVAD